MILSVTLCATHRYRVRHDARITFAPALNALVGPNGTGKSTILRALRHCPHCAIEKDRETRVVLFHAGLADPQSPLFRRHNVADVVLQTRGVFSSHGEIMRDALGSVAFGSGDTLLLDEPDTGQDAAWVERLRDALADFARSLGVQIIMATHHPLLWQGAHLIELAPGYAADVRRRFCQASSSSTE
jgi:energy-coupling factor transporter ATP-binding protein EcfA2